MKLHFARHGESEANVQRIYSNRDLPHHLTPAGRKHAQTLARRLQGESIRALYTSPIPRAVETAEIVSEILKIPHEITDALREYDCGEIEGLSYDRGSARYEKVLRDWMELSYWESSIEGGESFLDMKDRFLPFIDGLVEAHGATRTNIALIGHGGLYRCMLPLILENVSVQFAMTHAIAYTETVVAEPRNGGFICLRWGPMPLD